MATLILIAENDLKHVDQIGLGFHQGRQKQNLLVLLYFHLLRSEILCLVLLNGSGVHGYL